MAPKDWRGDKDPVFGLRLWLSLRCCGETLWAYDRRHLGEIRAYVAADLRERVPDPYRVPNHWSNTSMISRLPRWLKARKNRAAILRAIDRLAAK